MEKVYTAPLLDKLGARPGMRVALVGPVDREGTIQALLADRTSDISIGDPAPDTDVVFPAADLPAELEGLKALRNRIRPNGASWVVSRKGRAATLRYEDLLEAARAVGPVDNKVVSFPRPTRRSGS